MIVTYNRKNLLKECLDCVMAQTVPFSVVCVVDNHSTDGTGEYLDEWERQQKLAGKPQPLICHLDKNIGGAGGFSYGLGRLSGCGCDWILMIDDDAMIGRTYMERIGRAIARTDYLAYSGTVTTQGRIDVTHRRRLTNRLLMTYTPVETAAYKGGSFEYDISTFCGLVIRASLLREIGLPKAGYFIWFDDTEYCLRFHQRSRILNVNRAVLNHKTTAPGKAPAISWKHFYGFRNSIDIGRTYSVCPPLYMAYICANHGAHILIDSLFLALGRLNILPFPGGKVRIPGPTAKERRYRIQVYRDVLKGRRLKPDGMDKRYLPGTGPH